MSEEIKRQLTVILTVRKVWLSDDSHSPTLSLCKCEDASLYMEWKGQQKNMELDIKVIFLMLKQPELSPSKSLQLMQNLLSTVLRLPHDVTRS